MGVHCDACSGNHTNSGRSGLWEKKAVNALDIYVASPKRGPGGDR